MGLSAKQAATAIATTMGLICVTGPAVAYTVYVSNEKGNSITVLNSETLEVEETIPVGMRPRGIIQMLDLLRPIYGKTAAYGHFGRDEPEFTWENMDKVEALRADAGAGVVHA